MSEILGFRLDVNTLQPRLIAFLYLLFNEGLDGTFSVMKKQPLEVQSPRSSVRIRTVLSRFHME